MKLLKNDPKMSALINYYFNADHPTTSHDQMSEYAVKSFLDVNEKENEDEVLSILNEALTMYAEEERILAFYHQKVFRLLADIMSSIEIIESFPKSHETQREFNKNSRTLWREITALLSNGVQLYWMYFPDLDKKKDKEFRKYRSELLISAFRPPEGFMQNLKSIRNVHIHFDEYMNDIYRNIVVNGKNIIDQVVDKHQNINLSELEIVRMYDPTTTTLYHLGREKSSVPSRIFELNLSELSHMAASIMMTYNMNMVKPGWRFDVSLAFFPDWGHSTG